MGLSTLSTDLQNPKNDRVRYCNKVIKLNVTFEHCSQSSKNDCFLQTLCNEN